MQRQRADSASSTPTPLVPSGEPSSSRAVFKVYATFGSSVLSTSNQDPELRFHAFQAIFYILAALAGHAVLSFGGFLAAIRPIFDLAAVGGYGRILWAAWQHKAIAIPVLASFARKQSRPSAPDNDTVQ